MTGSTRPNDLTDPKRIAQLPCVGTDATDATHHFDAASRTVYVLRDGQLDHTQDIADYGLAEWVGFVADRRGWADCRLHDGSLTDWLSEAVVV